MEEKLKIEQLKIGGLYKITNAGEVCTTYNEAFFKAYKFCDKILFENGSKKEETEQRIMQLYTKQFERGLQPRSDLIVELVGYFFESNRVVCIVATDEHNHDTNPDMDNRVFVMVIDGLGLNDHSAFVEKVIKNISKETERNPFSKEETKKMIEEIAKNSSIKKEEFFDLIKSIRTSLNAREQKEGS